MFVVAVDPGWTVDIECDGLAPAAGNIIGHLTQVFSLVSVLDMVKLQCPLMTQGEGAPGRVVHPSIGGERVGFSVTSELDRVCIVHLVHAALGVN